MAPVKKTRAVKNVTGAVAEKAWNKLASERYVETSLLRQEIALSWKRCLQSNVDPVMSKISLVTPDLKVLAEQQRDFLRAARPHMKKLYESVKGMGFIVLLADAEGIILDLFGDRKMFNLAESLSLVPGASCSEKVIGTTSPGVCLVGRTPIQIFSREHYCQLYHDWCCSAAPVFDRQGNLLGTLDLSNNNEKLHHPLILGLVETTARAIEMELDFRRVHADFNKSFHYFKAIVDSVPEALLFFDSQGTITHINNTASKILGVSSQGYVGRQIEAVVSNYESVKQRLKNKCCWTELQFDTPKGPVYVNAHFKPIKNENSEDVGVVGTLKEVKEATGGGSIAASYTFDDLIYCSREMEELVRNAKNISFKDTTTLIQGESGTGKEIIAQAIHNYSPRLKRPFIAVNCAALPKDLIQSELFGYEEGTFTGAKKGGKAGKFELANGGTIFLDEIGDMPLTVQTNLLRVLQEKYIVRVGGSRIIPLDVRIIAATNKNLLKEVENGSFRNDLYYRLSVFVLNIPPLRERKEDLEVLLQYFIRKHASAQSIAESIIVSPQVRRIISAFDWPGNVRELENTVIYFLNSMKGSTVTVNDLPPGLKAGADVAVNLKTLEELEKQNIIETLKQCNKNITLAAGSLGITRATLYRKIKKYNIV
ncbi:MAG: sigma-54-dependent Fis family transcriptional regulator [Pelotomaculaceae bacterium]|jgi:PAS domain S-box-containing protein|uniref:Signal-transduction and transcriptional-control protein n=1 Tax=anaerobic digester metagenome TaxID=1263854 RepID=A0A485M1G8_9ZZZZ|nr:sigma-54-dependent Fis family transcriptional regulator [Bacillota bacterium]HHU85491.1 sigma-54-dependent Fis family transcriptional regulator [Peptococcaceae bacterium]